MRRDGFCGCFGICGLSMRVRRGCSTVVPMPADDLLACIVMLTWVRLEARPFHIPPRFALLALSVTVIELVWAVTKLLHREGRCALLW